jgi:hypothetical protein
MRINECAVLVITAIYLWFLVTDLYATPLIFSNTFDLPGLKIRRVEACVPIATVAVASFGSLQPTNWLVKFSKWLNFNRGVLGIIAA